MAEAIQQGLAPQRHAMMRLAIDGGEPVRADFLPFNRPALGPEEEQEIVETLRSGWLTTGARTRRFEADFAQFTGARHAIGVNSCTAALHLALVAKGIGEGDEVITTPITFAATANVIVHTRARPVFVDVEPDTLNIDPAQIEARITPRTKAIIPVHLSGQPCSMDDILAIARKHNLAVIEDAAHAAESVYRGRKVGSIGEATAFSFYATKNVTTGEGGMLTTDDDDLAEKVRILSLHGISHDAWKRYTNEGYKHYEVLYPGYKYNMFDMQAALGIHQLAKVEKHWQARKALAEKYDSALAGMPEVVPLARHLEDRHAHHLYIILVKTEQLTADRDHVMAAIQAENIGVGIHFLALHTQPFYAQTYGWKRGDLPNAEYAADRIMSLPLYPTMTDDDLHDAVAGLEKVIAAYRKG